MENEKTVVGLFDSSEPAQQAADALVAHGFPRQEVSIITGDKRAQQETPNIGPVHGVGADTEAGRDAAIGGLAGVVAGLAALAIPGIGPLLAVGPLAGALGGLGIGAAVGGLVGVLKDYGVSEQEAQYYEEGLRRGGALVAVRTTDDRASDASKILDRAGAADILQRTEEWRAEGWTPGPRARRAG
jgi:hypothetical protein